MKLISIALGTPSGGGLYVGLLEEFGSGWTSLSSGAGGVGKTDVGGVGTTDVGGVGKTAVSSQPNKKSTRVAAASSGI